MEAIPRKANRSVAEGGCGVKLTARPGAQIKKLIKMRISLSSFWVRIEVLDLKHLISWTYKTVFEELYGSVGLFEIFVVNPVFFLYFCQSFSIQNKILKRQIAS